MNSCDVELSRLRALYEEAREINANMCLLKLYSEKNNDSENFYIIKPLIEYTYKTSDALYANMIEIICQNSI